MNLPKILLITAFFLSIAQSASADSSGDLTLTQKDIRFSVFPLVEGKITRIYATIHNNGTVDNSGNVKFIIKEEKSQIGNDQPISVIKGKSDDVFVDWKPIIGNYVLIVHIDPWISEKDDPSNNKSEMGISVDRDTDSDGIGDAQDLDDDGDGTPDNLDAFPLNPAEQKDTDLDGLGDNADQDDDNDGIPDTSDAFATNPNESADTDKDGIGNNEDKDDDNDELTDKTEQLIGTNPLFSDTDKDSYSDKTDIFPINPGEWADFDQDKIGDNADNDDDNDGLTDNDDPNDNNIGPTLKIKTSGKLLTLNRASVFDASDSYDQNGYIKEFMWEVDGKQAGEGIKIAYLPESTGFHTITLTAIDDDDESRKVSTQFRVVNNKLILITVGGLLILSIAILLVSRYSTREKRHEKSR